MRPDGQELAHCLHGIHGPLAELASYYRRELTQRVREFWQVGGFTVAAVGRFFLRFAKCKRIIDDFRGYSSCAFYRFASSSAAANSG